MICDHSKHFDTTPALINPNNEKGRQLLGGLSGFAGHGALLFILGFAWILERKSVLPC